MKTIAIIPARGGSKRLPYKNRLALGGIPLIVHSILYAQQHDFIDDIYVSTDDEVIKNIALQYGVKVIDRPVAISGDLEPTVSALKNVLEQIGEVVENVILLQPTNPLRPKELLKDAFEVYQKNNCDSLFTVTRNHQKLGKLSNGVFIPFNYTIGQRSQDLEPLFYENGLLYITKANLIQEDIIISDKAFPFEVDHIFATIDIDTVEDFQYSELILNNYSNE
ncbi:acylneuraminate cytidylyltransferase family protein [Flavobacterium sp. P4023]|uniref:Acylneuraminate cytidylyltransferase family protein n=1 Tax=Flavobacterium flabelliforme TaxID=2816119 RepID=A0ABS5CPI4_9FLAO|nr:acylneuraminate cytidylyltransferase family protein [Flavobacterium flabelliforme]MBP4140515.1 acylneuraminate cytidylyltransferase family protein [Flavobacterium flabelliforme]